MTGDANTWETVGVAGLGAAVGIVGTIITALINKQHPMAALVDARIRLLIEGYERRINELQSEIAQLELKVDALTKELERARTGLGI
jgi:predicted RNase H-like nuclease (RuvC/YqgF family)